jgi:predicted ester cyclase
MREEPHVVATPVRELFDRGTRAFNAHDMDGFAETMADDVVVTAPGVHIEGKAAAVHFYRGWIQAFPDARVTIAAVHILDDVAVEEGVFSGTHRGVLHSPTGDLPPTGRAVEIAYIQVLRFGDAHTVGFNLMFDRLAMLEQLGVTPAA